MKSRLHTFLFDPKDAASVSMFRILFGCAMLYQSLYYISLDYTYQFMSGPQLLFSYPFLEFIKPLPEPILKVLLYGMPIAAIMVTAGWLYRVGIIYLFLVLTYFTLIDTTLYNNHLYLFMLLAFVMTFMDADKKFSIAKNNQKEIPAWNIYLLQFLIILVYFYGGIAKMNLDWLNTSIPAAVLRANGFQSTFLLYLITYAGLLFDLLIGFMLLYAPTRWAAVLAVIFFNAVNGLVLFDDIGIFPYFMVSTLVLFFPPNQIQTWADKLKRKGKHPKKILKKKQKSGRTSMEEATPYPQTWTKKQVFTATLLGILVIAHLLIPFRHFAMTYNPEWTGIASRFAWRMKMQTRKLNSIEMSITDAKTGESQAIDYQSFLTSNQQRMFINDPFCFVQLAKYLNKKGMERGMADPVVKASVEVSFNGRPPQLMLNPDIDLSKIEVNPFGNMRWIMPLENK